MKLDPSTGTVKFSSALLTTDLNDFLAPADSCILPLNGGVASTKPPVAPPGSVAAPIFGAPSDAAVTAKVTLSDCLSCSGCLTSAETILLETQSSSQLDAALSKAEDERLFVVCSVSQQSVASICSIIGADPSSSLAMLDVAGKLASRLRALGVDAVLDVAIGRGLALLSSDNEFKSRLQEGKRLPMLSSACPGFVCYAEKSQPELIPLIAETKSPQAMLGTVVKAVMPQQSAWMRQTKGKKIFHCSIMPCFDKKLESSRSELQLNQENEVDTVLTTSELWGWLKSRDPDNVLAEEPSHFDSPTRGPLAQVGWFGTGLLETNDIEKAGTSGGYADFVVRNLAKRQMRDETAVEYKALRNSDFLEAVMTRNEGETEDPIGVAVANGFRNIQNVARRVKQGKCSYNFIEIMSCPGGCTNGAGQVSLNGDASDLHGMREQLEQTNAFYRIPKSLPIPDESYELLDAMGRLPGRSTTTSYHAVQKSASSLAW